MDPAKQLHDAAKLHQECPPKLEVDGYHLESWYCAYIRTHYILQLSWVYMAVWSSFAVFRLVLLFAGSWCLYSYLSGCDSAILCCRNVKQCPPQRNLMVITCLAWLFP